MHENPKYSQAGMARSIPAGAEHKPFTPPETSASPIKPTNGATFDDSQSLSSLRKLQDSTKFDKARFSFRLYKR